MNKILIVLIVLVVLFIISWIGIFIGAEHLNCIQLELLKEIHIVSLFLGMISAIFYMAMAMWRN